MNCKNCAYFWKEDNEEYAQCHWEVRCPGDTAPCEDDYWEEPDDDWYNEDEYIEDVKAMEYVDAWKNGDYDY